MKITKIQPQKYHKNRWSIFIDHEFAFGMDAEDLYQLGLKEQQEITQDEKDKIENTVLYRRGKEKALRLLHYRGRTEQEIRQRLQQEFYPDSVIQRIIDFLYRYSFLDDKSYAEQFIKAKLQNKPMGKRMLAYQLQQKGIPKEVAEQVIDNQVIDEEKAVYQLIQKRVDLDKEISLKEKRRLYFYLQRRGFSYETIYKVFSKINWNIKEDVD